MPMMVTKPVRKAGVRNSFICCTAIIPCRRHTLYWSPLDRICQHQQAVRQATAVRRSLIPAEPGREGGTGRAERRRQDHDLPHDHGRRGPGRGRRHGPQEADHRLLPPGRRRDVGPFGAGRGHCRQRPRRRPASRTGRTAARDGRSGARRRHGQDPGPLRRSPGRVRPPRRLRARKPGARSAAWTGLRRRADRRRRRRVVGRLEDARGDGPRAARQARRAADGRADQPPRSRIDHLARRLPAIARGRVAHDLARPGVHEPPRHQDRRDRQRRDHGLFRRLRLLRARARDARSQQGSRLCAPAVDVGQGTALHRPLQDPRVQGGASAEPHQVARQDREARAAEAARGREVHLQGSAALWRSGRGHRRAVQGLRQARDLRRLQPDHSPRRAVGGDGPQRCGQDHLAQDARGRAGAGCRRRAAGREPQDGLLRPAVARHDGRRPHGVRTTAKRLSPRGRGRAAFARRRVPVLRRRRRQEDSRAVGR